MKGKALLLSLAAVLTLGSCAKESFEVSDRNLRPLKEGEFRASMSDAATKTVIDGNKVLWDTDDVVSIFKGYSRPSVYAVLPGTEGNTSCILVEYDTFGASSEIGEKPDYKVLNDNVAYYPYYGVRSVTANGDAYDLEVEFGRRQDNNWLGESFPMVAVTEGTDDKDLSFRNVMGLLRLQLGGNFPIDSVVVQGHNGEKLSGKATVSQSYNGTPVVKMAADASETVTSRMFRRENKDVIMAIPPMTFSKGLTVSVYTAFAEEPVVVSTDNPVEIVRSAMVSMEPVDLRDSFAELVPDNEVWYIAEDYPDKGVTSWRSSGWGANVDHVDSYDIDHEPDSLGYVRLFATMVFDGPVTAMPSFAFTSRTIEVFMPKTVTSFDDYAFNGSPKLEYVNFPSGLKTIGNRAVVGTSLRSLRLNEGLQSIGDGAFSGNIRLTSVEIPQSVETIGSAVFLESPVETFKGKFATEDGSLLIKDDTIIAAARRKSFSIPSSVTAMADYAFAFNGLLESITVPSSVKTIPLAAFDTCVNLLSVTLPAGLERIGEAAFYGCGKLSSIELNDGLQYIDNYAFTGCSSLTKISLPESLISITGNPFSSTKIASFSGKFASADGSMLVDGATLLAVAPEAQALTIPESITTIGMNSFFGTKIKTLTVPATVTSVSNNAFTNMHELETVTFAASIETMPNGAFINCISLKNVDIQSPITEMAGSVFSNCTALESISIPESVTAFTGYGAFNGCTSLKNVDLPSGLKDLGIQTFYGCTSLQSIEIPSHVENIGPYTFSGCTALDGVEIPESVTTIGAQAFYGCASLESISIPESVTALPLMLFGNCESLVDVTLPETLTQIGPACFMGCSSLAHIDLPVSLTRIDAQAFSRCTSLEDIVIPINVTTFGYSLFEYCSSLAVIIIYTDGGYNEIPAYYNLGLDQCPSDLMIFVPSQMIPYYQDKWYWQPEGLSKLSALPEV